MRFMTIVKGPENAGMPPQKLFDEVERLAQEHTAKGILVARGGLLPTATGARARVTGSSIDIKDGPFTEAKEVIGGFAIYELPSKAEALQLTREFLQMQIDIWPAWQGEVEIRQLWD
jgi:hypothetical protein